MIIKMCAKCKKIIEYPNRYCSECQKIVDEQAEETRKRSNRKYNKTRDPKLVKFRKSDEWRQLKEKYLQDIQHKYGNVKYAYKCEDCIEENRKNPDYEIQFAEEVHHLQFIETPEGWLRRLDYNNLRALCHMHHDKRHNRFQKRKGEYICCKKADSKELK